MSRYNHAAIKGIGHSHAMDGRQVEGKKAIVGHGKRDTLVAWEEGRFHNTFLPDDSDIRHVRQLNTRSSMSNPG